MITGHCSVRDQRPASPAPATSTPSSTTTSVSASASEVTAASTASTSLKPAPLVWVVHVIVAAMPLKASVSNVLEAASVLTSSEATANVAAAATPTPPLVPAAADPTSTSPPVVTGPSSPAPAPLPLQSLTLGCEVSVDSLHAGSEGLELIVEQTQS